MPSVTSPGTPSWLRERNERSALALLFEHQYLTRNQIHELTGLSKPTTALIITKFERTGLIDAVAEVIPARGPVAVGYGITPNRVLGVAIDITEKWIRATVVDAIGTEFSIDVAPLEAPNDGRTAEDDVRDAMTRACDLNGVPLSAVNHVAIGLQGAVDPRTDRLNFINYLGHWPSKGTREHLEQELGVKVTIENDVNLAAAAERVEGVTVAANSFALLWMSEGLGLAFDVAGTVHQGAAGGAGEIGALPAPWNVAEIDPSARNLEQLLGGRAIIRIAREHGIDEADDSLVLGAIAESGSRELILGDVARRVAVGLVPLLAIVDPEVIVLGGPIGVLCGDLLAELVGREIERTTPWRPSVVTSTVAVDPVLRGMRRLLTGQIREQLMAEIGGE